MESVQQHAPAKGVARRPKGAKAQRFSSKIWFFMSAAVYLRSSMPPRAGVHSSNVNRITVGANVPMPQNVRLPLLSVTDDR
jgi:hypothetical protein